MSGFLTPACSVPKGRAGSAYELGILLAALTLPAPASGTRPPAETHPKIIELPSAQLKLPIASGFLAMGLPAVWERPKSLSDVIGEGRHFECVDFYFRATGTPPSEVSVSTSGIQGATLLDVQQAPTSCPETVSPGTRTVHILQPSTTEHGLRLIVPGEAFPELSQGAKGSVVFLTPDRVPLEVKFTLRRQGFPAEFEVPLWFLGIGVPALLTSWIALIFARWQKRIDTRQQEQSDFEAFRKNNANKLRIFFSRHYHNIITEESDNKRALMRSELSEIGIISALPQEDGSAVLRSITISDWATLSKILSTAFPDCGALILRNQTEV